MARNMEALRREQAEIAEQVSLCNELPPLDRIRTVAGADISCGRFSKTGFAAVVVLSYPDCTIVETAQTSEILEFPYIPGYLAFREWPLVKRCLRQLKNVPDVLICDGQGIAHPRRAGLASHIGVLSGLITIGCAKSRLIGEYREPGDKRGSVSDLVLEGEKVGEVLRSRDQVKPLFVSPGHRIDFYHAAELILNLCRKYRQPEPIRAAHGLVNAIRKQGLPN